MGLVELLGSKNLRQHFSVGNNKNYSVTLFMIFLTIFLIILGRCFCWFLWAFLDCYWILWILTLQDRSSFNLVHEDVLKKVMILLQKGIQPIFCSFGNCCFCVLTSEDWDALSALYWSTFYEILVTQNLLGNLRFLYFLKTNVCDVSTKHFYQKDFFYCTILGIQLKMIFYIYYYFKVRNQGISYYE